MLRALAVIHNTISNSLTLMHQLVDANAFPEMNALTQAYSLNSGTDMQAI